MSFITHHCVNLFTYSYLFIYYILFLPSLQALCRLRRRFLSANGTWRRGHGEHYYAPSLWLEENALRVYTKTSLVEMSSSSSSPSSNEKEQTLLAVLGSGGHTAEMISLLRSVMGNHSQDIDRKNKSVRFTTMHFILADTDSTSVPKIKASMKGEDVCMPEFRFHRIPRSREVGQSYLTSVITTVWSIVAALWTVLFGSVSSPAPDVVLCNGPGTCLPVVLACVLRRCVGCCGAPRIIFVESFCRVESLSLTGKILYKLRLTDRFVVQWKQLLKLYPRAEYIGTVY